MHLQQQTFTVKLLYQILKLNLYQKSFGVPSQQIGVSKAVSTAIQTQLDKSRWKVWKMFWTKDPRRTRRTQETPNNVMVMQKDTICLAVGPAAFSAITI